MQILTCFLSVICFVFCFNSSVATASSKLVLKSWEVSWKGRPRDPFVDHQGRVWFCGQAGNYLAYLEPDSGRFKKYELSDGVHPHNLIVDTRNQIWYAGNTDAHIGRLNPDTGKITKFKMPSSDLKDPHTLVFNQQGNIWFTAQWGNAVGFLNTSTGKVNYAEPDAFFARPYGIKISSKNEPWVVLLGTNQLVTVDPDNFRLSEVILPRSNTRPRRLEIDQADNVWYADYEEGFLGRYSPEDHSFKEWQLPSGKDSKPYGTAMDKNQIIWIAETGVSPNRLVGFDTRKETFIHSAKVPGGGSVRHMYYHEQNHEFWFGVDTGFIVRARITDE